MSFVNVQYCPRARFGWSCRPPPPPTADHPDAGQDPYWMDPAHMHLSENVWIEASGEDDLFLPSWKNDCICAASDLKLKARYAMIDLSGSGPSRFPTFNATMTALMARGYQLCGTHTNNTDTMSERRQFYLCRPRADTSVADALARVEASIGRLAVTLGVRAAAANDPPPPPFASAGGIPSPSAVTFQPPPKIRFPPSLGRRFVADPPAPPAPALSEAEVASMTEAEAFELAVALSKSAVAREEGDVEEAIVASLAGTGTDTGTGTGTGTGTVAPWPSAADDLRASLELLERRMGGVEGLIRAASVPSSPAGKGAPGQPLPSRRRSAGRRPPAARITLVPEIAKTQPRDPTDDEGGESEAEGGPSLFSALAQHAPAYCFGGEPSGEPTSTWGPPGAEGPTLPAPPPPCSRLSEPAVAGTVLTHNAPIDRVLHTVPAAATPSPPPPTRSLLDDDLVLGGSTREPQQADVILLPPPAPETPETEDTNVELEAEAEVGPGPAPGLLPTAAPPSMHGSMPGLLPASPPASMHGSMPGLLPASPCCGNDTVIEALHTWTEPLGPRWPTASGNGAPLEHNAEAVCDSLPPHDADDGRLDDIVPNLRMVALCPAAAASEAAGEAVWHSTFSDAAAALPASQPGAPTASEDGDATGDAASDLDGWEDVSLEDLSASHHN